MKKTLVLMACKIGIIAIAASCLVYFLLPALAPWESIFLDWHLRDTHLPENDEKIAVILGRDTSMIELGNWPWPRSLYADLLAGPLASAHTVALDIFLVDKTTPEDDLLLAGAIARHGNVVLGNVYRSDGVLLNPLPEFRENAFAGYLNYYPDSDYVVRRYPLAHKQENDAYRTLTPSFVYAVLDAAGYAPFIDASNALHLQGIEETLVLDSDYSLPKFPLENRYSVYEFSDVIQGKVPADAFKDATVFVGISSTGATDNIHTSIGYLPGTQVLADIFYSILSGYAPRTAPMFWQLAYYAIVIGLSLFATAQLSNRFNWLPLLLSLLLFLLLPHLLFIFGGIYLPTFAPAALLLLCGIVQLFYLHYIYEARQKQEMLMRMITCFVSALDAKDPITAGHSLRVSEVSARIAAKKGLKKKEVENIRLAGLIHDIGKLGVPDTVLNKPGKFTPEEYEQIKEHPNKGIRIMAHAGIDPLILSGIGDHHERPDGKGYPGGKKSGELSLYAEIIKIADVYDALSSKRQYKEAWPIEKVCNILYQGRNTEFNAELVDLLLNDIRTADWQPEED